MKFTYGTVPDLPNHQSSTRATSVALTFTTQTRSCGVEDCTLPKMLRTAANMLSTIQTGKSKCSSALSYWAKARLFCHQIKVCEFHLWRTLMIQLVATTALGATQVAATSLSFMTTRKFIQLICWASKSWLHKVLWKTTETCFKNSENNSLIFFKLTLRTKNFIIYLGELLNKTSFLYY